jgi:recombination protein RecR
MSLATSPTLEQLMHALEHLPGVGPKTAQRLAFHLLKQPESFIRQFAETLVTAHLKIKPCSVCFHLSEQNPCPLCQSPKRHRETLCVVVDPRDVMALERTQNYHGLYHVLGGLISPLDGVGPEQLNIKALLNRLKANANSEPQADAEPVTLIREVILALPPSTEGDTTSLYLTRLLKPTGLILSRIAFGLPVGGDLDYADHLTLTRAMDGRRSL